MKPFNLERALAGDKVVCRDPDYIVLSVSHMTFGSPEQPVYVELIYRGWAKTSGYLYGDGKLLRSGDDTGIDLFMAEERDHETI